MATLQKFKLLATQCAVAGSPTRSPTTSPVIHLRRRKTLRMLLSRSGCGRRIPPGDQSQDRRGRASDSPEKEKELVFRHKLKDLLLSSPPFEESVSEKVRDLGERFLPATACANGGGGGCISGSPGRRSAPRSLRPLSATLRQRLLRRVWRPVLFTIPE